MFSGPPHTQIMGERLSPGLTQTQVTGERKPTVFTEADTFCHSELPCAQTQGRLFQGLTDRGLEGH